jgi:hypothetical protein
MLRRMLPYVLGIVFVAGLANAPVVTAAAAGDTVMHSGIVASVDAARGTLTLQEMGPWSGPDTNPTSVSIALRPTTIVEVVQRSTVGNGSENGWQGGYVNSPMKAADLHAGAFANVSTVRDGTRLSAVSIEVVQPSTD